MRNQVGKALCESCSQPPGSLRTTECGSHTDGQHAVCRATSSSQRMLSTWLHRELAGTHCSLHSRITGKAVYKPVKGGSFIQEKRLQRKSSCLAYNLFPCLLLPGHPAVSNTDMIRRGRKHCGVRELVLRRQGDTTGLPGASFGSWWVHLLLHC